MNEHMSQPAPSAEPRTILLIDDEQSVRSIVMRILKRASFKVLEAESGEALLQVGRVQEGDLLPGGVKSAPPAEMENALPLLQTEWAMSGTTLAKVVEPGRLKAVLSIPETQAKDVAIGQRASIDTRNGVIAGHVTRIDPAARSGTVSVDVALDEALPQGARPDLTVDGTIEIERLPNVLHALARATPSRAGNVERTMTLAGTEFMRRFLQHALPTSFMKVRYYGFMNPNCKVTLDHISSLIERTCGFNVVLPKTDLEPRRSITCPSCGGALRLRCVTLPSRVLLWSK